MAEMPLSNALCGFLRLRDVLNASTVWVRTGLCIEV